MESAIKNIAITAQRSEQISSASHMYNSTNNFDQENGCIQGQGGINDKEVDDISETGDGAVR